MVATTFTSAPPALAFTALVPSVQATWIWFETRAATVAELLVVRDSAPTSRPFFLKMPASMAIHSGWTPPLTPTLENLSGISWLALATALADAAGLALALAAVAGLALAGALAADGLAEADVLGAGAALPPQ